jgi:hypothetical protein
MIITINDPPTSAQAKKILDAFKGGTTPTIHHPRAAGRAGREALAAGLRKHGLTHRETKLLGWSTTGPAPSEAAVAAVASEEQA